MKIDLTCPIEMRSYEVICDDRGYARAYIRFQNLAPHPIDRFDAVACWSNSDSGASTAQSFRADIPMAAAREGFRFSLSTAEVPEADTLEVRFTRVHFADGTAEWIGGLSDLIEIDELPREEGRALTRLRAAAGEDAVRFPEIKDTHWLCVCGRACRLHEETCPRCLRDKRLVLNALTRETILAKVPSHAVSALGEDHMGLSAPEDHSGRAAERAFVRNYRRWKQQRDVLIRRTVTMGVIILLLMAFGAYDSYRQRAEAANRGAIPPVRIEEVSSSRP